jgi:hypothetical protein
MVYRMRPLGPSMAHNHSMTTTGQTGPAARSMWSSAVAVGVSLIVAELLLALLWYPWVVEHLVLRSRLPFEVLRLLIVAPEYLLLSLAVSLVALTRERRVAAVCCALLAGLVAWGESVVVHHLASTPFDLARHRELLTDLNSATLVVVPLLGALAWALARRHGPGVLAIALAPVLHYWIQHSQWAFSLGAQHGFRMSEAIGMSLVIVPVLLAILAGWALEERPAATVAAA